MRMVFIEFIGLKKLKKRRGVGQFDQLVLLALPVEKDYW